MAKEPKNYGNDSITSLKGPDRVRLRPAVIFGSEGLEGCEHAFFEILANSLDEAREGYGTRIDIEVRADHSIKIEDFGRGVPLGWNEREQRYNWDLVYCELYAGGKYNNDTGEAYEYSLGINGLGACATQFSSEYMNVTSYTKENKSSMRFEKGYPVTELIVEEPVRRRTGTVVEWLPDLAVFTDIDIPFAFFDETVKKQAVVNAGVTLSLDFENPDGTHEKREYLYKHGIVDYVNEIISAGGDYAAVAAPAEDGSEDSDRLTSEPEEAESPTDAPERTFALTTPAYFQTECKGRDRGDMNDYKLKIEMVFCFSNMISRVEFYHNSSYLEHGGSPDKATRAAFVKAFDLYLKNNGKYTKNESKITYGDIEDCLIFIVNSHSTRASYENQTKKAITNTFIAEAMTDFFLHSLEVFFAENPAQAEKAAAQVLINKRSRENAESARVNIKKKLEKNIDIANRVEKFVNCRSKDAAKRELYIVEGDSALGSVKLARNPEYQAVMPVRGKTLNC
ncbi:MAG: DNA topoisomerase, partial [Eubacteriales bacterium]